VEVFDIMVEDVVRYARCQVNRKNYDGRLSVCGHPIVNERVPDTSSLYDVMNRKLNNPNRNEVKFFVRFIWLLLGAMAKCPASSCRTVYRGIKYKDMTPHFPNHREFVGNQFSSCSCGSQ
jgi:hypothetical protein